MAATNYMDAVNGNDAYNGRAAAWDGENGPKLTLQAAVDAAAAVLSGFAAVNATTILLP